MTPREHRAANIMAQCYAMIDIMSERVRAYIEMGDSEMAARSATRAAFEAGHAAWVEAKVNPGLRPFLAPMSARPPDTWTDATRRMTQ